jgi:hypothetical protein
MTKSLSSDSRPRSPRVEESDQHKRFIETARQLECDEDQERFEKKLGKIAKAKPKGQDKAR